MYVCMYYITQCDKIGIWYAVCLLCLFGLMSILPPRVHICFPTFAHQFLGAECSMNSVASFALPSLCLEGLLGRHSPHRLSVPWKAGRKN